MLIETLMACLKKLLANKKPGLASASIDSGSMKVSCWIRNRRSRGMDGFGLKFDVPVHAPEVKGQTLDVEILGQHAHELEVLMASPLRMKYLGAGQTKAKRRRYKMLLPPGCPVFFDELESRETYPDIGALVEVKQVHPRAFVSVSRMGASCPWVSSDEEFKSQPSAFLFTQISPCHAVATDGHRMSLVAGDFPVQAPVYADNRLISIVGRIISNTPDQVDKRGRAKPPVIRFGLSPTHLVFQGPGWEAAIPVDKEVGGFPDEGTISSFTESPHSWSARFEKASAQAFIDRSNLVRTAKRGDSMIALQLWEDMLADLQVDDHLNGPESCAIPYRSGAISIDRNEIESELAVGINPKYLEDAVNHIEGPVLVVEASGPVKPVRFSDPSRKFISVVMPLKTGSLEAKIKQEAKTN